MNIVHIFLLTPFIFAFILGINLFLKNTITIRKIAISGFLVNFLLSAINISFSNETGFLIKNIEFQTDKISSFYALLSSFLFLLFSIIAKSNIFKMHRGFYSSLSLISGLINIAILSNNIFIIFLSLFWIFLLFYFLDVSFAGKKNKKLNSINLFSNLFWLLCSFFLIFESFARYFILNDIQLTFLNISKYIYKIDDFSINLAFIGFAILIFKLFNFIPFANKKQEENVFIQCFQFFCNLFIGSFVLCKCYLIFNYLFYQNQDAIAIFLILNFIIYSILAIKQEKMFDFLANIFRANLIIGLFSMFSFEKECFGILIYFTTVLIVSYCFCAFVFIALSNIFKTTKFEELKIIDINSKLCRFFSAFSLLNISSTPLLAFFSAEIISLMVIFSTNYEGIILNITPYILIIGAFIISGCSYNVIYKILVEPNEKATQTTSLAFHQTTIFAILTFTIIILSFLAKYILDYFSNFTKIGNF